MADSHGILADITAEFGLQQYERSEMIVNGGGKWQEGHQASATTQSTLSPEEQECVQMRAALHMSALDNRGEAGMTDQQRWELLGCTGRLNRVGYPGGERNLVEDDRTVGLAMAEAAEVGATPRQTLPLRSRILSELQVTEETPSEEKGQQQGGEVEDMKERTVEAAVNVDKLPALLVIAVVTIRPERRTAIRNSWLAWGDDRLVLRFFTEAPDESMPNGKIEARDLEIESAAYGDVVILDIERGMNFALKLLTAMKYVSARYDFDFFLRLDDDYFVCLDHLLDELETAKKLLTAEMEDLVTADGESNPSAQLPQPMIYAGFRYCKKQETRIDEAYMLLSSALVHRVLSIPDLRCGAHAGISAGSWFTVGNEANENGDVRWVHDHRLDHYGSLWKRLRMGEVNSSTLASVCQVQMGVHHSYPKEMGMLWEAAQHGATAEGKGAWGGDTEEFQYKADTCPTTGAGIVASTFDRDNVQPCESYHSTRSRYCGAQGC